MNTIELKSLDYAFGLADPGSPLDISYLAAMILKLTDCEKTSDSLLLQSIETLVRVLISYELKAHPESPSFSSFVTTIQQGDLKLILKDDASWQQLCENSTENFKELIVNALQLRFAQIGVISRHLDSK